MADLPHIFTSFSDSPSLSLYKAYFSPIQIHLYVQVIDMWHLLPSGMFQCLMLHACHAQWHEYKF